LAKNRVSQLAIRIWLKPDKISRYSQIECTTWLKLMKKGTYSQIEGTIWLKILKKDSYSQIDSSNSCFCRSSLSTGNLHFYAAAAMFGGR
jgi:hypothetical protein